MASAALGAARVDPRSSCVLDGPGELEAWLAALPLEVWQVPERPILRNQRDWRMGVRLGPNASGALAYIMWASPPGIRRVGVRGILDVSSPPGQKERPASMYTDAPLGYAGMGKLGRAAQPARALGRTGDAGPLRG